MLSWCGQPLDMGSLENDLQFHQDCNKISECVRSCLDDVWTKAKVWLKKFHEDIDNYYQVWATK